MSKYIPKQGKRDYQGQVKPKLKVKVVMNEEEAFLNEYDAFTMISELKASDAQQNKLLQDLATAVQAITDGMNAATAGMSTTEYREAGPANVQNAMKPSPIKLPKLKKVTEEGSLSGGEKFYNSDGNVNLQS